MGIENKVENDNPGIGILSRYFSKNQLEQHNITTKSGEKKILSYKNYNLTKIGRNLDKIGLNAKEQQEINEYIKDKDDNEKLDFFSVLSDLGKFKRKTNKDNEKTDRVSNAIKNHKENKSKSTIILENVTDENNKEIVNSIYDFIDEGKDPSEINRDEKGFSSLEEFLNSIPEDEKKKIVVGISKKYEEKIKTLINEALAKGITPDELADQLFNKENEELFNTYSQYKKFKETYRDASWIQKEKEGEKGRKALGERKKFENLTKEEQKEKFKCTLYYTFNYYAEINETDYQAEIDIDEAIDEFTYEIIYREPTIDNARERFKESEKQLGKTEGEAGRELAEKYNLGPTLASKFSEKIDNKINIDNPHVFKYARKKFCDDNKDFNLGLLPPDLVNNLYKETNNFKDFKLDGKDPETIQNLKKFKALFGEHKLQYDLACKTLEINFQNYLKDAQEKVSIFHSTMSEKMEIVKNNISIGHVIDGIKNIFTNIGKENNTEQNIYDLELDKEKPVALEEDGTGLILTGTFKGNPVKIKYDLMTGNVYMNTCISKTMPYTLTYGRKEPDFFIGQISDFTSTLNNFDNPQTTETQGEPKIEEIKSKQENQKNYVDKIYNERLTEIQKKIEPYLENNQSKNEASTNLLKTLGIIKPISGNNNPNGEIKYEDRVINFEEGSDAYKVMQIINNSETKDILAFSNYMKEISIFVGRNRGNNIPNSDKTEYNNYITYPVGTFIESLNSEIENCTEEFRKGELIRQKESYKNIIYFSEKLKELKTNEDDGNNNFNYEGEEGNVSKDYKNPFASIIYEKFINESKEPDRKLDRNKIEEFYRDLTIDKDLIAQITTNNKNQPTINNIS